MYSFEEQPTAPSAEQLAAELEMAVVDGREEDVDDGKGSRVTVSDSRTVLAEVAAGDSGDGEVVAAVIVEVE